MAVLIDFRILKFSIVNTVENSDVKGDKTNPYSFIDFVKNLDIDNVNNDFVVDVYNKYIIEWSKIKKLPATSFVETRKQKYVDLLKSIQLDFLTQDEQRILGNIDYNNPLELDIAIPFFVEKIKDIIVYYQSRRRSAKNAKLKWSTKGSKQFLENTIAEYIIDNYTKSDASFQKYKQTYQPLDSFHKNFELKYDGLYDFNDYRTEEVIVNEEDFLKAPSDYTLSNLALTSFSDYNRDSATLISELKKDLFKKYISVDSTYSQNGSSVDVNSVTPFYDPYNYGKPLISDISDETNLLKNSDIGYFFTSRYIYTSNYFSPYGIKTTDTASSGLVPTLQYNSENYRDFYFWSKYDSSHLGLANKPVKDKQLKRFYGYMSRDSIIGDASGGVERYTDNTQLWTGDKNEAWANEDIFDKFSKNILNRKSKTDFFFHLNEGEHVYKYVTDIYGNEYYLIKYKNVPEYESSSILSAVLADTIVNNYVIGQRDTITDELSALSAGVNFAFGAEESISNVLEYVRVGESFENIVYPLGGGATSFSTVANDFVLLGQRVGTNDALGSIQIQSNLVIVFYVGSSGETFVETLADYNLDNLDDFVYKKLDSARFNTVTKPVKYDANALYKSVYEDNYTVGRVLVRTPDGLYIQNLQDFIPNVFDGYNKLHDQLATGIYNIDILNETVIITTEWYSLTAKVNFNFRTSRLTFSELTKNISFNKNSKQWKTASYWYSEKDSSTYFCNIKVEDKILTPEIWKINMENNVKTIIATEPLTGFDPIIELENISRPNVIKHKNIIYIVTMISDICDNYSFNLLKYNYSNGNAELIANTLYTPNKYRLTSALSESTNLASEFNLSSDAILSSLVYYNSEGLFPEETLPISNTVDSIYYDNDSRTNETVSKPDLQYNLSDILNYDISSDPITSITEETYEYETELVYTPSLITLDYKNITGFSSIIPATELIVKIEYNIDGVIYSKNLIDPADRELPSYNESFVDSPINEQPLVYENTIQTGITSNKNVRINFYSVLGKQYILDIIINSRNIDIQDRFSKIELLDSRIKSNVDSIDLTLYLNTRDPDLITSVSLLNI